MSAPSTSLSFSLDALVHPRHSSRSFSSSSCSRYTLPLNLSAPQVSLRHAHSLRFLRGSNHQSLRPADPYSPFSSFLSPRTCSLLGALPRTGAFLGPDGLNKLQILEGFRYVHEFHHGSLEVRLMAPEEVGATVRLLAESFADSILIPSRYIRFLEFLVEQYVVQKRAQLPHAATLVLYYQGRGVVEAQFAGTAEVSFNAMGGNVYPPSPVPPRDAPYICNMTVKETLRRRGFGWHLLKACEELISKMSTSTEVYLHCRLTDVGPLNMYKKADYSIVKTDSMLVWLRLQQRKHLMCKKLRPDVIDFDDQPI